MQVSFEHFDKNLHNREDFDCGEKSLNDFLQRQAGQRQKRNDSVTHVAVEHNATIPKIIYGYFSISAYSLRYESLPPSAVRVLPREQEVPCMKLGRLARNKRYTNSGFGGFLLSSALEKAVILSKEIGIYLVDVDAINERARQFYLKYGFHEFPNDSDHLFITLAEINKLGNS